MYVYIHIYIYTYMFVCTHVRMYAYTLTQSAHQGTASKKEGVGVASFIHQFI